MVSSLNAISAYIASEMGKPLDFVTQQEIKFAVKFWRAFLLRQDVERNGLSPEYVQSFSVGLKLVDSADTCIGESGCKFLKTVDKVPLPANLKGGSPYMYVGTLGYSKPFGFKFPSQVSFANKGKWIGQEVFYFLDGGYIYIVGNLKFKFLTVSGVFNDPEEVVESCIKSDECFGDDEPYPIASHLLQTLITGIINGRYSLKPNQTEVKIDEQ
jgi:hypothetical protein